MFLVKRFLTAVASTDPGEHLEIYSLKPAYQTAPVPNVKIS